LSRWRIGRRHRQRPGRRRPVRPSLAWLECSTRLLSTYPGCCRLQAYPNPNPNPNPGCCRLQAMEASRHGCSSGLYLDIAALPTRRCPDNVDTLAAAYDSVLTNILHMLLPVRHFIRRARPSDASFNKECRNTKRHTRTLQRRYSSRCRLSDSAGAAWLVTPGTTSDDSTVSYGIERHPISGVCVLSLNGRIRRECGDPSIGFLTVTDWPPVLQFWPMNTATTSPTKLMRFAGLPQIHARRTLRQ